MQMAKAGPRRCRVGASVVHKKVAVVMPLRPDLAAPGGITTNPSRPCRTSSTSSPLTGTAIPPRPRSSSACRRKLTGRRPARGDRLATTCAKRPQCGSGRWMPTGLSNRATHAWVIGRRPGASARGAFCAASCMRAKPYNARVSCPFHDEFVEHHRAMNRTCCSRRTTTC